jgi:DNA mismatch endonuclease (patch repair protein)
MSKQASKGTKPERELAVELRKRRYIVKENDSSLPGRPDLVLPNQKIAIFVHGCFWHGCPKHGSIPKHNRKWWIAKIQNNKTRDGRKVRKLRRMGWSVFQIWEHEDPSTALWRLRRR